MKITKKILLFLFLAVLFFTCKDSNNEFPARYENLNGVDRAISIYNLKSNGFQLTNEQSEMIQLLAEDRSNHIAVQATANWGNYSPTPSQSFTLMGRFPTGIAIQFPFRDVTDEDGDGLVVVRDTMFKDLFGKNISFNIKGGSDGDRNYTSYIPKLLTAPQISSPQRMEISRNKSNKLTWNPDSDNPLKVVLLQYYCKNDSQNPMGGKVIKNDVLVIDDDGEFDIQPLLADPNIKSIQLNLIRGVAFPYDDEVLFSITTNDMHLYQVSD